MPANVTNPYLNFRFKIQIAGMTVASFSEANIPDSSVESVDYREGTDPNYARQLSGLTKFTSLSLKRGISDSMDLYNWFQQVTTTGASTAGVKKNISLILIDESGNDKATWTITNAWPSKYQGSGFNAKSGEVMIETVEITLETLKRTQ